MRDIRQIPIEKSSKLECLDLFHFFAIIHQLACNSLLSMGFKNG